MYKNIPLFLLIILILCGCNSQKADYISERAQELMNSGINPKGKKLIILSGDNSNSYLVHKLNDDELSTLKIKMEKLLGDHTAKVVDFEGMCTIIVDPNKAFSKYGRNNIDLLLAHEIGHCYGNLLNKACKAGDCLNPSKSYEQYIEESFADFIGIYKLASKTGKSDSFNEKITINEGWTGTQYDYKNNTKSIKLAQSLFNSDKNLTDFELARLFISGVCSSTEFSSGECISTSKTD